MKNSKLFVFRKKRKFYYTAAENIGDAIKKVGLGFEEALAEKNLAGTSDNLVIPFGGKE